MKFEIDPNELTTDQRTHVAAFITGWPVNAVRQERVDQLKGLATSARMEQPTEEQRLDSEQKSDMREGDTTGELREISGSDGAYELGAAAAVNLNAIFGSPPVHCPSHVDYDPNATIPVVPLDAQGLPWDSRIHASTKTFIADGSWKLRRGVESTEVAKVKEQLKALMAVPKFTDLTSELLNVAFNTPNADNEVAQALVDAARVPVPPAPVYLIDQDPTVAANQQPTPVTLTDLIGRMSKAIAEDRLSQANVTEICVKHGVSEFHLLSNRPDLLPLIDVDMKAMGV